MDMSSVTDHGGQTQGPPQIASTKGLCFQANEAELQYLNSAKNYSEPAIVFHRAPLHFSNLLGSLQAGQIEWQAAAWHLAMNL